MRTPADAVVAALDTAEWQLIRKVPVQVASSEQTLRPWAVHRTVPPLSDSQGECIWFGATAHAALAAAHTAFGRQMPEVSPSTLTSVQLSLYFAVSPVRGEDDEVCAKRQTKSYNALSAILIDRGMAELGTCHGIFSYVPVSLFDCDWDGQVVDGHMVYAVHYKLECELDPATAAKLRAMALEAYTKVCGADARFVRAELHQSWSYSERTPFNFE